MTLPNTDSIFLPRYLPRAADFVAQKRSQKTGPFFASRICSFAFYDTKRVEYAGNFVMSSIFCTSKPSQT